MNIPVNAGGNLQAAIDAFAPGDVLVLEAGATFEGCFSAAGPVTMTTSGVLPERPLTPQDVAGLPTLRATTNGAALRTVGPASGWRLSGIHLAANSIDCDVVLLGDGLIADLAGLPRDLAFDRCAITATTRAKRGIQLNSAATTVRGCCIQGIRYTGVETQAICGWNGPGPFTIEDNYIEAGSIGVLFGGAGAAIPNLIPSDITFKRNTVTRPLDHHGTIAGIKNLFELKNAKNVVAQGNLFENNWVDGQSGFGIVFTVRANSANAPWSTIQHVLFEHNIVRNVASVFNILGLDNQTGSGGVNPSTPMDDVVIRNNLIYEIDRQDWKAPNGNLGAGVFVQITGAPRNLQIINNTAMGAGSITGNITALSGDPMPGFVFKGNIVQKSMDPYDTYGVFGDQVGEGNPALQRYAANVEGYPASVFTDNVLAGCTPKVYDQYPGQHFPSCAELADQFVDPSTGNFRLVEGSPFIGLGVDMDALEAAFGTPTEPIEPPIEPPVEPPACGGVSAETIQTLADDALETVADIGGDVAPQTAAQHAIEEYRDALLAAL